MGYGLIEQKSYDHYRKQEGKPWKQRSKSGYSKWIKVAKHKSERQRVRQNIECIPGYNRFCGYE